MPATSTWDDEPGARLLGLGTANPELRGGREQARRFMMRVAEARTDGAERERILRYIDLVTRRSGVDWRHTVVPDFLHEEPGRFELFAPNWELLPEAGTGARMGLYQLHSPVLAATAAERAIEDAAIDRERITHVVVSTCTGFFAPGVDVELVQRLGLSESVHRTVIGFMGCQAGFNGMRMADEIVRANPNAVVLQVCVELCSIHFQAEPRPENVVANSLFADGAAAALYAGRGPGRALLRRSQSRLLPEHAEQMTWRISDAGFVMFLDGSVPGSLRRVIDESTQSLLGAAGITRAQVEHWIAHPGGPRILDALQGVLDLDDAALSSSRGVLRDFGNMSSATILFVLARQLEDEKRPGPLVAMGFGPGLTIESCLLEVSV